MTKHRNHIKQKQIKRIVSINKHVIVSGITALLVLCVISLGLYHSNHQNNHTHAATPTGSASFAISPASGSLQNGSTLTATVTENSGSEAIDTVQINVDFNPSQLSFQGSSTCGSVGPLSQTSQSGALNGAGNVIETECGIGLTSTGSGAGCSTGCVSGGPITLETLTFKVIGNSGTSSLSFDSSSLILAHSDGSQQWNGVTSGSSYNLTAATAPSCPSGDTGTYPNCVAPSCPSGDTGTYPNCVAPKSNPGSGSGGSPTGSNNTTTPTAPTSPSAAKPVSNVKSSSTSSNNNVAIPSFGPSSLSTAQTPTGDNVYGITIQVLNSSKKPVSGATVKLSTETAITNSKGLATFRGLPGFYKVSVSGNGIKSYTDTITVSSAQSNQQFTVYTKSSTSLLLKIVIIIVALALIAIGLYLWVKHNRHNPKKPHIKPEAPNPAIIGGNFTPPSFSIKPEPIKAPTSEKPVIDEQRPSPTEPIITPGGNSIVNSKATITPTNKVKLTVITGSVITPSTPKPEMINDNPVITPIKTRSTQPNIPINLGTKSTETKIHVG